jgi:hypothetical protein
MQNLHDVFSAICADEGDHVATMAACLDADANLRAPSTERRILTGIALLAVASYLVTTTGILDGSLLDSANVAGDAAVGATDTTLAELLATGIAGFAEQLARDEEARDLTGLGEDLLEGGAAAAVLEPLRRFFVQVVEFIARVL